MRKSNALTLSVLSIAVLLLPNPLAAQGTGIVQGKVTDLGGDPLSGASILVQGTSGYAITDGAGEYEITGIPEGLYVVECFLEGFKPASDEVNVPAGGTATADFTLELDVLNLDSIVVTGSISPYAKIESSVAVTTQTSEQISEKAPLSTAQMLEVIPGFWSESSGGEGGNNLFARGIPGDGSFRYVAMHEDGLPVYESPELAFTNVDLLYRIDESVEAMEGVRGGTSSIFASNAPGGVVNFINKTGGNVPEGLVKLTVGDYDLFRADIGYGGPLGENWRFHVGGFYRYDNGIRDPGFPANRGGQVKASITRLFDNGYFRLNAKKLEERDIFYLPVPLQDPRSPRGVPGFDPNFGTLTTNDAAIVKIPTPDQEILTLNLKNGMNPEIQSVGGELFLELDNGWTIKDAFRSMSADVSFNAIFSLFDPADANLYALGRLADVPGAASYAFSYSHFPDLGFDPANANGNGLVVESGWWNVEKPLDNFANDLRFTKNFDNHAFSVGVYFSDYSADERWIFNNVLTEVRDAPRLLELQLFDANGDLLTSVTQNGFTQYGGFHRSASSDAFLYAIYLADEWQATDKLRIDAGLRYEDANFSGNVEQLESFNLGDPTTTADDSVLWGNGNFIPYDFDFDEVAFSVGLNYSFNPSLALYGRYSEGFRMPDFDNWTDGNVSVKGDVEDVRQIEGGVKYSSPRLGAFAAIFFSEFDNVPFTDEVLDAQGNLVVARRFASTETLGLEAEVVAEVARNFTIALTATYQQPEFQNFRFNFGGESFDFSGNQVRRIPELLFTIKPAYRKGPFSIFASYLSADDRFVDDANTIVLPSYEVIDAGIGFDVSSSLTVELHGNNLTNEIGLTEGNPRTGQIVGVQADIFMARPILGRSWRLSAAYRF